MNITDIIPIVTTPLALAALALLLGAGILREIAKKRSPAKFRTISRNVFVLALVFGVLANFSYVFISFLGAESRMSGTVRDEQGRPLDGVRIELDGSARTITLDDGTYELVVPRSRRSDEYHLWVRLPGYESMREKLAGPDLPRIYSVELKKRELTANEIFRRPPLFRVRHHLGNPIVDVQLQLVGADDRKLRLSGLRARLVTPLGESLGLNMAGTLLPMTGQYSWMPLPDVVLDEGLPWTMGYRFVHSTAQPDDLLIRANQEWYSAQQTNLHASFRLSGDLLAKVTEYQKRAWRWVPGRWKLLVDGEVEGQTLEREYQFELVEADIDRLRSTDSGYSIGQNLAFESTLQNANGLIIELR